MADGYLNGAEPASHIEPALKDRLHRTRMRSDLPPQARAHLAPTPGPARARMLRVRKRRSCSNGMAGEP